MTSQGVGKNEIAMRVCDELGGEIVSADSVQVYRQLEVGANKPSCEERKRVPHHLLDLVDTCADFTAGAWCREARRAIHDIVERGRVPVVVGGTMMYMYWLVEGTPDAPRGDASMSAAVEKELQDFKKAGDWASGLGILAAINPERASQLNKNDWVRLSRSLVVSRSGGMGGIAKSTQRADMNDDLGKVYNGYRTAPLRDNFDVRAFFLAGDRVSSARRTDSRCAKMIEKGLLQEVTQLIVNGHMHPEFMCAKAIGYRQSLDYLLASANSAPLVDGDEEGEHGNCHLLNETEPSKKALAFWEYFERFTAATRSYSANQYKWFRSSKGKNFMWIWRDSNEDMQHNEEQILARQPQLDALADEVVRWSCFPSSTFLMELRSEHQAMIRNKDRLAANQMRYYIPLKPWGQGKKDNDLFRNILKEASDCTAKIRGVTVGAYSNCVTTQE